MQPLSLQAVRDWVGDHEVGKGRPYTEAAIIGARRSEDHDELAAFVRGTRARPYRVSAFIPGEAVSTAHCTCPVGGDGKCKHVAAVLLAFAEDPDRFPDLDPHEDALDARPREELLAVIDHFLTWAPELKPLLAVPMPGYVRGPVSADLFRRQALEVIRSARLNDDWTEEEVLEGLSPLLVLRLDYHGKGNAEAAEAVVAGVVAALRESGLATERMRDVLGQQYPPQLWQPLIDRLSGFRVAHPEPPF